jgi:hypothetical protein
MPPGRGWVDRRRWLDPIVDPSLETLLEDQAATGRSLGVIRLASIERLVIRRATWDTTSRTDLAQLTLDWTGTREPHESLGR